MACKDCEIPSLIDSINAILKDAPADYTGRAYLEQMKREEELWQKILPPMIKSSKVSVTL